MKILVSTTLLAPYRVDWLDELGKYADIDVFYTMDSDTTRDKDWCGQRPKNCNFKLLKSYNLPLIGQISFEFKKILKKKQADYDIIILDGYGYISQIINMRYLNRRKINYFVNVDGMIERPNDSKINTFIKKKLLRKVPYFLCGSLNTSSILMKYGVKKESIINHPFTSLKEKDILTVVPSQTEKKKLKGKWGISYDKVVLAVGQFIHRKGFDVLLKACIGLPNDVGVYIIGGKPTKEYLEFVKANDLKNVHFLDFMCAEDLKEWYDLSDLFALPTREDIWGLVINEAMARGLPIITTNKCVSGVELIENGENGFIINVDDHIDLNEKMLKILSDVTLRDYMAKEALKKINFYTIENIAKIHIDNFKRLVENDD